MTQQYSNTQQTTMLTTVSANYRCSYTKRVLASRFYPETTNIRSAVNRLRRDIERCQPLNDALIATGYNAHCRAFNIRQVSLIFDFLGEP